MEYNRKDRYRSLADLITSYSVSLQTDDVAIIECIDVPQVMINRMIDSVRERGGKPIVWQKSWETIRHILDNASKTEIDIMAESELDQMRSADAYIGIRASLNESELKGVSNEDLSLFNTRWLGKVHYGERVHTTNWCSTKWPTSESAKAAGMTPREFEEYYLRMCLDIDYENLSNRMDPLVKLINKTENVRIVSPSTDIRFTMRDIPAIECAGYRNLPDGEVRTSPNKKSVEGKIKYNVPSSYQGSTFRDVEFVIRNGRIDEAQCSSGNNEKLNSILNTDEGARYIGEFAFGTNPVINKPVNDSMFDEKMLGSIHLTPGNAYSDAYNGNNSSIHWDLILDLRKECGGGNIYFDNKLIFEDGKFVIPSLRTLNLM